MTKKSVALTFVLSWVPGLGHLYLGLNGRGLQFMAAAFACIVLIPVVPLVFPFVLALVWFGSLFDALQRAAAINTYVEATPGGSEAAGLLLGDPILTELDRTVLSPAGEAQRAMPPAVWLGAACMLAGILVLFRLLFPQAWSHLFGGAFSGIFLGVALIAGGAGLIWAQLRRSGSHGAGAA